MVSTKITRQRMENQIVSAKITRPRVAQCTNNSPNGWTGGELNGQHENNSPKDGIQIVSTKITLQTDGRMES